MLFECNLVEADHKKPDSDRSLEERQGSAAFNIGANAECGLIHDYAAPSTALLDGLCLPA